MAVHHIDVDPIGAGRVDGAHFLAQPREVGGQNRGCDEDFGAWLSRPNTPGGRRNRLPRHDYRGTVA